VKDGKNGYIVPRNKVNPISDKVLLLLKDQETARRMGQLNLNTVRNKADCDKNYIILENLYNEMAGIGN